MAGVVVEQPEADLVQRRLDGGYLGKYVNAVTVLLDHLPDAADLALDPADPGQQLVFCRGVAPGVLAGAGSGGLCVMPPAYTPPGVW